MLKIYLGYSYGTRTGKNDENDEEEKEKKGEENYGREKGNHA